MLHLNPVRTLFFPHNSANLMERRIRPSKISGFGLLNYLFSSQLKKLIIKTLAMGCLKTDTVVFC